MTDVLAALTVLVDLDRPERAAALARFYERWSHDELVIDKWFALQARSSLPHDRRGARADGHPAFSRSNPNRVRALVGTFAQANQLRFHDASGAGYALLADEVIALDPPTRRRRRGSSSRSAHGAATTRRGKALMRRNSSASSPPPTSARTPTRWCRRASGAAA